MLFVVPAAALAVHQLPDLPAVWILPTLGLAAWLVWAALPAPSHRQSTALLKTCVGLLAFFCACAGYVVWQADRALAERLPVSLEGHNLMLEGRVAGLVRPFAAGQGFDFVIASCRPVVSWCASPRRVRLGWYGHAAQKVALHPGDRWRLTVRLKRPHATINPGGFDAELRALAEGISARGYVRGATKSQPLLKPNRRLGPPDRWRLLDTVDYWRGQVARKMSTALLAWPDKVRGTLVALVTGEQQAIPAQGWQEFNRTGTSHLMSISGLHVTMFAALATLLARWLLRRPLFPARWLLLVPAPALLVGIGAAAAFGYTLFSGWGIPAQRTSLMLAVAGVAILSGRASGIGPVMAMAGAAVVVVDPWAPMAAGFWLSFVAVGAIVLFGQGVSAGHERALVAAVRTQWAATVSLVPLGAVWFGTFSLVSPLANAVAIPVISVLVTPMALLAAALQWLWPWAGTALLQLVAWPAHWLLSALAWASALPYAVLVVGQPPAWVLGSGVLGCWVLLTPSYPVPRWWGYVLLLPQLTLPVDPVSPGSWRLLALDIGQGNAVLVQTAHHALLFDTGPTYGGQSGAGDRIVTPVLQARRIGHLDALLVSHGDLDHAGGATTVLGTFDVARLLTSVGPEHPLSQYPNFSRCERSQHWEWDGVQFEILHPGLPARVGSPGSNEVKMPARKPSPNASSCVLRIRGPGGSALLTGDIERKQEKELLALYGAAGLRADVLMAPHHGSNTSSSAGFIAAVQPKWVFFQAGYRNRFGHPTAKVVGRYVRQGVMVSRSDRDGAVEWRFASGQAPQVIRYRNTPRRYWRIDVR